MDTRVMQAESKAKHFLNKVAEYLGSMESPPSFNISSKYLSWNRERHAIYEIFSEVALPCASYEIFILPSILITHYYIMVMCTRDMVPLHWTTQKGRGTCKSQGTLTLQPPPRTHHNSTRSEKNKNSIHPHVQNALADFPWGMSGTLRPGKASLVPLVSPQCTVSGFNTVMSLVFPFWQGFGKTGQTLPEWKLEPRPDKAGGVICHAGISISYFPAQPFCTACRYTPWLCVWKSSVPAEYVWIFKQALNQNIRSKTDAIPLANCVGPWGLWKNVARFPHLLGWIRAMLVALKDDSQLWILLAACMFTSFIRISHVGSCGFIRK